MSMQPQIAPSPVVGEGRGEGLTSSATRITHHLSHPVTRNRSIGRMAGGYLHQCRFISPCTTSNILEPANRHTWECSNTWRHWCLGNT